MRPVLTFSNSRDILLITAFNMMRNEFALFRALSHVLRGKDQKLVSAHYLTRSSMQNKRKWENGGKRKEKKPPKQQQNTRGKNLHIASSQCRAKPEYSSRRLCEEYLPPVCMLSEPLMIIKRSDPHKCKKLMLALFDPHIWQNQQPISSVKITFLQIIELFCFYSSSTLGNVTWTVPCCPCILWSKKCYPFLHCIGS